MRRVVESTLRTLNVAVSLEAQNDGECSVHCDVHVRRVAAWERSCCSTQPELMSC
jgi:hypothetical protein